MVRVFPGLRKHAIVPVDVVRIEPELALLGILLDRVGNLISSQLHLGGRLLGDLAYKVESAIFSVKGDVMPGRDGGALGVLEDAELKGVSRTLYSVVGRKLSLEGTLKHIIC